MRVIQQNMQYKRGGRSLVNRGRVGLSQLVLQNVLLIKHLKLNVFDKNRDKPL